jgi:hypothetical protein
MAKKSNKSMAVPSVDKDWQAESDMRTLVLANEIRSDKERFKRALKYAKDMMDDLTEISEAGAVKDED